MGKWRPSESPSRSRSPPCPLGRFSAEEQTGDSSYSSSESDENSSSESSPDDNGRNLGNATLDFFRLGGRKLMDFWLAEQKSPPNARGSKMHPCLPPLFARRIWTSNSSKTKNCPQLNIVHHFATLRPNILIVSIRPTNLDRCVCGWLGGRLKP